jgi:dipeptidase D
MSQKFRNQKYFVYDLNAVPRPSKKRRRRVIEFMKTFGKSLGLETFEDDIRNVISVSHDSGMENRKSDYENKVRHGASKNSDTVF